MYRHRHSSGERPGGERRYARGRFGLGARFGGHQRGGRLGRMFDQGDLRYVLLQLITEKPRHGYELIKEIEEKFGGMYSPSPGIVYPNLSLLEELGYLRSEAAAEGTRKLYTITEEGANYLA